MIYLIDSPLVTGSHSYWMMKIIERFYPGARINFFSQDENPTIQSIIDLIEKVIPLVNGDDVVLCSWMVDRNARIDNAFRKLAKKCSVVCAAGNYGADIADYSPQHLQEVLTVGCINKSGAIASMSNRSIRPPVKLLKWVPGTNLNMDGHIENGTSVSAAIYAAWLSESIDLKDTYLLNQKLEEYTAVVLSELMVSAKAKPV